MAVPLNQALRVGAYVVKQHLLGRKRYPLVLMLEPLFRCNLACAGCGKIDYPAEILNQRLSVAECMAAIDECGAPVVVIAGGEPLLHREIEQIVEGAIARKKFVIVCTNALLLEKKMHLFQPSRWFSWSVHLDGSRKEHDISVCQDGVYDRAVAAIGAAKRAGFRTIINATLFDTAKPERVAGFFDDVMAMGVDGISVSPGYAYERAPDQQHFLNRRKTKELFRGIFARQGKTKWAFNQSSMFLDFLAGNQTFHCTPWGNPTRTYFGWQRPCYLLGEGYATEPATMRNAPTAWCIPATRRPRFLKRFAGRGRLRHRCCAASVPTARWRPTSRWRSNGPRNSCSAHMSSRH
jgi:hopanoid biosynthesis associated radical SAM protein HpnH